MQNCCENPNINIYNFKHGEVSKQLATSTKTTSEATKEKEEMRTQLEDLQITQNKVEERLQQSTEQKNTDTMEFTERIQVLENENSALSAKFVDLTARKDDEIIELKQKLESLEENMKVYMRLGN